MTDNKKTKIKGVSVKICPCCKEEKPADLKNFYKDSRSASGLSSWCRECQKSSSAKNKKKDNEFSFKGFALPDTTKTLVLNFARYEDLFARLKATAEKNFRTPEMQVMWTLAMDVSFLNKGE